MKSYPRRGQMVKGYRYTAPLSFKDGGWLASGSIPADCIEECSAGGRVDEAVEYWRKQLNLSAALEPVRRLAEEFLGEYGAWEDLSTADIDTLADRILWLACCDIREQGEWYGLVH